MPKTATPRKPETLERRLAETRNTSRNRNLAGLLGLQDRNPLRDMLSAANDVTGRGMIAGLIGTPGDLGGLLWDAGAAVNNKIKDIEYATGLLKPDLASLVTGQRKGYIPASGQPYGGSEHIGQKMQEYGLVSPTRRPVAETLASLISPSAAATAVFKAPSAARAGVRMLDNLAARRTMGSQTGAIENLWHGSPHTFDRFDLSKIGTGEGAQAYGHGAYLAESPDVAVSYRDALGTKLSHSTGDIRDGVRKAVIDAGGSEDEALLAANEAPFAVSSNDYSRLPESAAKYLGEIKARQENTGQLYQTRLAWPDPAREATDPLSPDHFLHWDKPLSEQSPMVQAAMRKINLNGNPISSDGPWGGMTGEEIYRGVIQNNDLHDYVSGRLGIPGIRYLDGGSRGAGAGSHNYVVFDDRMIDIVSRNGQPVGNLGKMVAPDEYDVIRYDADGDIPTFDKPHGIYTTPKGVESPHTGVGGNVSKWKINPNANVLNIEVVDGKSLAMRRDAVGAGAGVAVTRELLGTPVFNEIKGLSKPQLIDWIAQNTKFDRSMFEGYYDSQEVMEGLGGMLARDRGYDAISYKDRTPFWGSPEFDEVVLLSEKSILGRNGQQVRK